VAVAMDGILALRCRLRKGPLTNFSTIRTTTTSTTTSAILFQPTKPASVSGRLFSWSVIQLKTGIKENKITFRSRQKLKEETVPSLKSTFLPKENS